MPAPPTLEMILASTRNRVQLALDSLDAKELEQRAQAHKPRGFRSALEQRQGHAIIAELKQASPSKGVLRGSFHVAALATQLEEGGAAALSVLTEPEFFQGSLAALQEASLASHIPCLCKDFILHEFQLLQARASGADAVLLIAAALPDAELSRLLNRAHELALDVLCEAHDAIEVERVLEAGALIVGVNSRNLRTFAVDPELPLRLAEKIPHHVLRVAESGIQSGKDLRKLAAAGYHAFLVGESLMRAESPGKALERMLAELKQHPLRHARPLRH